MAKIILIEPDVKLGKIYCQFLENEYGHKVTWHTSAQSALTSIDQVTPDLIILELQLAAHNGIEFLYEFRSYTDWKKIPVLIHSQIPPMLKAISPMLWDKLNIAGYYYKPSTKLKELASAINSVLVAV